MPEEVDESSVFSDKLAKRSKRRKWWAKWKTRIVVSTILFVTFIVLGAFTPFLPQKYHDYIMENRFGLTKGQTPQVITEEAARQMYQLGYFYSITLREKKAAECFGLIEQWYYGYNLEKLGRTQISGQSYFSKEDVQYYKDFKTKKVMLSPDAIRWVGLAVGDHGEWLWLKRRRQQAMAVFTKFYIPFTLKHPNLHDKKMTTRIKVKVMRYKTGG